MLLINFFHSYLPNPILLQFGFIKIYWYGLLVSSAFFLGFLVCLTLSKKYFLKKEVVVDFCFWLAIFGLVGARFYEVFLDFNYYLNNPLKIFYIWEGGLAIHGGIIAGIITIYFFCKKNKINFFKVTSIVVTALALGQAIGRWGNYFNQELFGKPTSFFLAIPISKVNRPLEYINNQFFHPTFFYESLGCFFIFIILICLHRILKKDNLIKHYFITVIYLILYSVLRFFLEFVRIDETLKILNLRWPQFVSLVVVIFCLFSIVYVVIKNKYGIKEKENINN